MLPPWIIEKLKKKEKERKREQPCIHIEEEPIGPPSQGPEEDPDCGVTIIDPGGEDE